VRKGSSKGGKVVALVTEWSSRGRHWRRSTPTTTTSYLLPPYRHTAYHVDDIQEAEKRLIEHGIIYTKFLVPGTNMFQCFFFGMLVGGGGIEGGPPYGLLY